MKPQYISNNFEKSLSMIKPKKKKQKPPTCSRCKEKGHAKTYCPNNPNWKKGKETLTKERIAAGQCTGCASPDHKFKFCPDNPLQAPPKLTPEQKQKFKFGTGDKAVYLSGKNIEDMRSKRYRLNNLYKITDKDQNLITFRPNLAQRHYLENKSNRNIILKSRQLGFTTYSVIDMLDDVLYNPNFNALLISYDETSALDIFDDKVMLAWEHYNLNSLYDIDTKRANKLKVGFRDGPHKGTYSSIMVKNSGRSGTFRRLHVSEYGKICSKYPHKAKEIISGSVKAVPLDGEVTFESTAEGDIGGFHKMFWDAWNRQQRTKSMKKLPTEYSAFFYSWKWDIKEIKKAVHVDVADMDEGDKFLQYMMKHKLTPQQLSYYYLCWISLEKDWALLHQEMPTTAEEAFVSSASKLFDGEKLLSMDKHTKEPIERINDWNIYEDYIPGHLYAMGVDPAGGDGKDHSGAAIIDFSSAPHTKVVATYKNKRIKPDAPLAHEMKAMGFRYGTCMIAIERNNHGYATIQAMRDIYPIDMLYKQINTDNEDERETEKLGWYSSKTSKPKMMYDIVQIVNTNELLVPDRNLLHEMKTYNRDDLSTLVYKDTEGSRHWDVLMATAIAFQMKTELTSYDKPLEVITLPN